MKTKHSIVSLLLFAGLCSVTSCIGGRGGKDEAGKGDSVIQKTPVTYNIYVENSGSMVGYCDISNKSSLETLVNDYYQVLNSQDEVNAVALNFINTSIERGSDDIISFQKSIKGKCTATYTKIDDMLNMMMDSVTSDRINLLFSDYVFTTDNGNLQMASNAITSMFTKQLKNKDLAVVIYKYMVDFNGKYYPGGIRCNKPLPLYVWAFGNRENLRDLTRMPFISSNCGVFFLQKSCDIDFKIEAASARVTDKNKKTIYVSKWDKVRHEDYYEITLTANMKDVLLTDNEILSYSNYRIQTNNSSKYRIDKISKTDDDEYTFTIQTNGTNPSPGELTITYPITTPQWVAASNFTGTGIPADSTTYGVSYLIDGVNKAFKDVSKNKFNYFEIKLNLE